AHRHPHRMTEPFGIRPLRARDRPAVARILESVGNFTPTEIATALELIDAWLATGESSDYYCLVLDTSPDPEHVDVQGYVCYGPTPLTESTFDLYWIAVDRAAQGNGYGRRLIEVTEQDVRRRHGTLLMIETSSLESYGSTIHFYERAGYALVARVPNFYRAGDDKLIFAKNL
ncbi:MAG TPA: N-acetyltransferase, partial [Gemmatimonadaceae bacterium]|nr:N-acetyltransferase [Gemmatimonadaceae bacterium]